MLRALLASLALIWAASPAFAEPHAIPIAEVSDSANVERVGESLRHRGSGYMFRAQLGDMPARKLIIYDDNDVSVQYTRLGGGNGDAWMDVYVYPAWGTNDEEAASTVSGIMERFDGGPIESPTILSVKAADASSGWFKGHLDDTKLITGYYLVQRGDWQIKVRVSMPREPSQETLDRTAAALADIEMDIPPTSR